MRKKKLKEDAPFEVNISFPIEKLPISPKYIPFKYGEYKVYLSKTEEDRVRVVMVK